MLLLLSPLIPGGELAHAQEATPAVAELLSPQPGTALDGNQATFVLSKGSGVKARGLLVGTSKGAGDLFRAGVPASGKVLAKGMPTDGSTVYVRVASRLESGWQFIDYLFIAATDEAGGFVGAKAELQSPEADSTFATDAVTFTWSAGDGVASYALLVGTSAGANDLHQQAGKARAARALGLPTDGSTIYVRLGSLLESGWQFTDYKFTAATVIADVEIARAELERPIPGTALTGDTATFRATPGAGVLGYGLWVGTAAGTSDIFSGALPADRTVQINNIPTDGSTIHVRLHSLFTSGWKSIDYTLGAADDGLDGTQAPVEAFVVSPPPGSTLPGQTVAFVVSEGVGVLDYGLIVGTSVGNGDLFRGVITGQRSTVVDNLPTDGSVVFVRVASRLPSGWRFSDHRFIAATAEINPPPDVVITIDETIGVLGAGQPSDPDTQPEALITVDEAVGLTSDPGAIASPTLSPITIGVGETVGVGDVPGATTTTAPQPVTITVRETARFATEPGVANTTAASLLSPAPGSTLLSDTALFTWSAGTEAMAYFISIGSTRGAADIFATGGQILSARATNLPTDGSTIYVRLASQYPTGFQIVDYEFTAHTLVETKAVLLSPANLSKLSGSRTSFVWSAGEGVTLYALSIGTNVGGADIFATAGDFLSVNATGLPTNGSKIFVRLASFLPSGFQVVDYVFITGP